MIWYTRPPGFMANMVLNLFYEITFWFSSVHNLLFYCNPVSLWFWLKWLQELWWLGLELKPHKRNSMKKMAWNVCFVLFFVGFFSFSFCFCLLSSFFFFKKQLCWVGSVSKVLLLHYFILLCSWGENGQESKAKNTKRSGMTIEKCEYLRKCSFK